MDNKKPRIAFCFSGQARTLDQTYLFFQKNLFDASKEQGFEYDVFCVVEDDEDADKVNLLNPTKVEKIKSSEVEKIISFKIDKDKNLKYFDCDYAQFLPRATQQQWYKIERSFVLMEKYSSKYSITYDMVFRLRFDVYFKFPLNFGNIKETLLSYSIIVNKFRYYPNRIRSIHDFYFICNRNSAKTLSNSMLTSYKKVVDKNISFRFVFVKIAANIILSLLKINFKLKFLSNKKLEWMKRKYMYGIYVPEILLYKVFLFRKLKVYSTLFNGRLLRKTCEYIDLHTNGVNEKFEKKEKIM